MEITSENLVIVLDNMNDPTVFNSQYFIKKELVNKDSISDQNLLTIPHQLSQFETDNFRFQSLPNQIIISSLLKNCDEERKVIKETTIKLINLIGDLFQIKAIGINFHYKSKDIENINQKTRDLFVNKDNFVLRQFDKSDASFGVYASQNFGVSRLRMEIKPVILNSGKNALISVFNFSVTINDNSILDIKTFINQWEDYKNQTEEINTNLI